MPRLFTAARPSSDDALSALRLIRSRRVGPATYHRLVAEHGGAAGALAALPEIAAAAGVRDYAPCPEGAAEAEIRAGQRAGARLILIDSPDYPALLRQIPDAPPAIWVKGNLTALSRPLIAVIGARNASSLGLRMARGLAGTLAAQGIGVVSGLARGIDTAAHEASLKEGTVAVMAGGVNAIYPAENRVLAATICDPGCLISEHPPETEPVARHFPLRNRIISGLSAGVVVVEAAVKSGSLITARLAADQGREVMAVPGHPADGRAGGCNLLIRDGATLVRNAADVLAALGNAVEDDTRPEAPVSPLPVSTKDAAAVAAKPAAPMQPLTPRPAQVTGGPVSHPAQHDDQGGPVRIGARILSLLSSSPCDENALIRDLGLTAAAVAPVLLSLELEGRITRLRGNQIALI